LFAVRCDLLRAQVAPPVGEPEHSRNNSANTSAAERVENLGAGGAKPTVDKLAKYRVKYAGALRRFVLR
jgi:hypothetical protein